MINGVVVKGRKMVIIVDFYLKRDDNYNVYIDVKNRDMMVKGGGGEEYEGWCWLGKEFGKEKYLENSLKGFNIYMCIGE